MAPASSLALSLAAVLLLLGHPAAAQLGGDVSSPVDEDGFSCMMSSFSWTYTIVRSYQSYGAPDPNAVGTLSAASSAGLAADVYHFPCAGQGASAQIESDLNNLESGFQALLKARNITALMTKDGPKTKARQLFTNMWLDIETNPSSGCEWSDPATNCDFISRLIAAVQNNGVSAGVYASADMWSSIAGDDCTVGASVPLWYAHYDGNPSFSDFYSFGGWTSPYMKQYDDSTGGSSSCGVSADADYQ